MTKTCSKCSIAKDPINDFYARSGKCKDCERAYQRAYTAKIRQDPERYQKYLAYQAGYQKTKGREKRINRFAWLDEIKAKPCMDCGGSFPPECMDFDHRDPSTKKFDVSGAAVSGRSIESVQAEVEKCDLICSNCHRIRTAKQQNRRPRHRRSFA